MPRNPAWPRNCILGAASLMLICLSACSGGEAPQPDPNSPAESPEVALTYNPNPSIDTRTVNGDGFTIAVPARFEEQTRPGPAGTTNFVWILPESGEAPPFIGVMTDPEPQASAEEQTKALELSIEADGTSEVTRSTIDWPGKAGESGAILLQWETKTAGGSGVTTNWQLVTTVEGGKIFNVVANAPKQEFDKLGLAEVVATFTPRS